MNTPYALKLAGACLFAGTLFGVGIRLGQWLVPAPALQVMVSLPESPDTTDNQQGPMPDNPGSDDDSSPQPTPTRSL